MNIKKHFLRILILTIIVSGVFYLSGGWDKLFNPSTIRAFGDLLVEFGVPPGSPIFSVINMKPGNEESHSVNVKNNGSVARYVAVKGLKTNGVGSVPFIESGLNLTISDGATDLYNDKLENFFDLSKNDNEYKLGIINPGQQQNYNFLVTFPASAGDEYQAKSVVFDLTFGVITGNDVVINEVFYNVDSKHGSDSPKDRNDKKLGLNNEWLELYNPTDKDISLKNWSLVDNSGIQSKINANKIIKAGSFLLVSKDASTWKYWDIKPAKDTLELGNQLGDGLDNNGDQLILKNATGVEVDRMGWGTGMVAGHSTERLTPGFDTNNSSDWTDRFPPTPGN